MIKNIFMFVGIYSTIANIWRGYEIIKYRKITPSDRDTLIALYLAVIIYLMIK